jgi:hypothetical protein
MSTRLWRPSTATNFAPWQVRQPASLLSASAMRSLGTADSLVGIQRSCYEEATSVRLALVHGAGTIGRLEQHELSFQAHTCCQAALSTAPMIGRSAAMRPHGLQLEIVE